VFSRQTTAYCGELAATAEKSYAFGSTPKGFDWVSLFPIILGLIQTLCKPKTAEAREALVNQTASKVAMNGVKDCIECLGAKAAKKLRHKMARRLKVKSALMQDKLAYTAIMAAAHNKVPALGAMDSAYSNNESDDDDE
jgi:hypothetical protein